MSFRVLFSGLFAVVVTAALAMGVGSSDFENGAASSQGAALWRLAAEEPPAPAPEAVPDFDDTPAQFEGASGVPRDAIALSSGVLRYLVRSRETGGPAPEVLRLSGDSVKVEIGHALPSEAIGSLVASHGGDVYGEVPGLLAEALVPVDSLVALEAERAVDFVRPPLQISFPEASDPPRGDLGPLGFLLTGEEVEVMNADSWQQAGYTGQGVKVGIIDTFDGDLWDLAQAAGEVPEPAGTFCREAGGPCSVFEYGSEHGVAVAEIVHEMAPDATIYLAAAWTASDMQEVVDYFDSMGVDIISRSESMPYDGPGNGTGPVDTVVNGAADAGMLWVNSAGNRGGLDGVTTGDYWRMTWNDPDNDGVMNFAGGGEFLPFWCSIVLGFRWDDWGANPTDYDVEVYDEIVDADPQYDNFNDQTAGAQPLEMQDYDCDDSSDTDYLVIRRFDEGNGSAGDILEFLVHNGGVIGWQNPYSAAIPAVDSTHPGVMSVGAIDPPFGTTIAVYSSWGPTNDGRVKPDVSAPSCVDSFTYFPDCFNGTSASTPAVAGAAALVLGAEMADDLTLGNGPIALAAYLKASTVERGLPGPDSTYGVGEVILGDPPDEEPVGTANDFSWYQAVLNADPSECVLNMPVPPASPFDTGLCVKFDLDIPADDYDLRFILQRNGVEIENELFANVALETGPDWLKSFPPPAPNGLYRLEIYADESLIGASELSVTTSPGEEMAFGDVDCSGGASPVSVIDGRKLVLAAVGSPANQPQGCPEIGDAITVDGVPRTHGDVDCSGGANPVSVIDGRKVVLAAVGSPANQPVGCPDIGETVIVG